MSKTSSGFPGLKKLEGALRSVKRMQTKVGWFPGAKYEDGTPVAYVAVIQEYGATLPNGTIPPRSFMRTTVEEKKEEWSKIAQSGAKAVTSGKVTVRNVMEGIGMAVAGDIRKKITEITTPPLKESTIRAKKAKLAEGKKVGSLTKPLIETGLMMESLTSTVEHV